MAWKPISPMVGRAMARGVAAFFGVFSLLNLVGEVRARGFDANCWWIGLRPAPAWVGKIVLMAVAVCLVAYAVRPGMGAWRRRTSVGLMVLVLGVTVGNSLGFAMLLLRGQVRSAFPVPLSGVIGMGIVGIIVAMVRRRTSNVERRTLNVERTDEGQPVQRSTLGVGRSTWARFPRAPRFLRGEPVVMALTVFACAVAFPLLQMLCFGKTDYRRPAEVAVVFGARAYADGTPSLALADRVRTGCRLYRDGLVDALVFSGGPGDGEIDEPEAMKRMAVGLGVPEERILLDREGLNTEATVRNTAGMFREAGVERVLAVSHFWHLPRVKLAYQRAGVEVYTVPAEETRTLAQLPKLIVREVVGLWVYYGRPLWRAEFWILSFDSRSWTWDRAPTWCGMGCWSVRLC